MVRLLRIYVSHAASFPLKESGLLHIFLTDTFLKTAPSFSILSVLAERQMLKIEACRIIKFSNRFESHIAWLCMHRQKTRANPKTLVVLSSDVRLWCSQLVTWC